MFNGLFKLKKTKDIKILNESGGTYIPSPIGPPPPYPYQSLPKGGSGIMQTGLISNIAAYTAIPTTKPAEVVKNIVKEYLDNGKELELLSRVYKCIREYKESNR